MSESIKQLLQTLSYLGYDFSGSRGHQAEEIVAAWVLSHSAAEPVVEPVEVVEAEPVAEAPATE